MSVPKSSEKKEPAQTIQFYAWWKDPDSGDAHNRNIRTFWSRFAPMWNVANKSLQICGVNNEYNGFEPGDKPSNTLRVSYSREIDTRPKTEVFDLHFCHEPDDFLQKTVLMPFFAYVSEDNSFWTQYSQSRQLSTPKTKFCTFNYNHGAEVRDRFRKRLQMRCRKKKVDCCSKWANNCRGFCAPYNQPDHGKYEYFEFLKPYKFCIAFENALGPVYLTEKLAYAYLGHTIPIYWGTPRVLDWLNPESFLYLADDRPETMERLIDRIVFLDQNEEAYMNMFRQPLMTRFPMEFSIAHWAHQARKCLGFSEPVDFWSSVVHIVVVGSASPSTRFVLQALEGLVPKDYVTLWTSTLPYRARAPRHSREVQQQWQEFYRLMTWIVQRWAHRPHDGILILQPPLRFSPLFWTRMPWCLEKVPMDWQRVCLSGPEEEPNVQTQEDHKHEEEQKQVAPVSWFEECSHPFPDEKASLIRIGALQDKWVSEGPEYKPRVHGSVAQRLAHWFPKTYHTIPAWIAPMSQEQHHGSNPTS